MTAGSGDAAATTGSTGPTRTPGSALSGSAAEGSGPSGHGWPLVVCYAAVAGASQLLWLTYAPVTTAAAAEYGVSVTAIGWLANVFPLLYVVLAVPAGIALDRSPRRALAFGVVLTALGGVLRLAGTGFGWALAGQLLVAVAQPFVLNAITGVAAALPPRQRPTGIAVGSAGLFLGMVVALGAGAVVGGDDLRALMVGEAAVAVVAAAAYLVVRRRSPEPDRVEATEVGELRRVWTDPVLRRIAVLAFLGFGVFIALTTWLQALARATRCVGGGRRGRSSRWRSPSAPSARPSSPPRSSAGRSRSATPAHRARRGGRRLRGAGRHERGRRCRAGRGPGGARHC